MKLVTFSIAGGPLRLGAHVAVDTLVDVAAAAGADAPEGLHSMQGLIDSGDDGLAAVRAVVADPPEHAVIAFDQVTLAAPLPRPVKLRDFSCFEKHLKQAADGAARTLAARTDDPEAAYDQIRMAHGLDQIPGPGWYELPVYYYSDATTVVGSDVPVDWPAYSQWMDYELELAIVIGRTGKDIARDDALSHVFGYTIFNDLSARDAQLAAMRSGLGPAKGKDFDGSNVLGPCIVTADEVPDPCALEMIGRVNGEEISRGHSSEMHWRFEDCIEYASRSQTIHAGEVFGSGTVGNGSTIELGVMLRRGDLVELEIEGIGVLRTPIC